MHGRDPIYPNIYSILVGDAGNGKSMAIGDVRELLTEIERPDRRLDRDPRGPPSPPRRPPGQRSPRTLHRRLQDPRARRRRSREVTPVTIIANEFVNFINKAPENWIHLLNDIYDTDKRFSYFTKNQGQDTINRPLHRPLRGPHHRNFLRHGQNRALSSRASPAALFSSTANVASTSPAPSLPAARTSSRCARSHHPPVPRPPDPHGRIPHAPANQRLLRPRGTTTIPTSAPRLPRTFAPG